MVTTQTADKVLKSYYLDAVSDQLNFKTNPFLAKIKQTTSDVWGKDVRKTVRVGLNGGVGAGSETGNLPAPNANRYEQFVSTLKNLYGRIEISDKAIRASQNNEGAFINLLNDEMEGLIKSSSFNFGRMLYGDGTGIVTKVTEADSTTGKYTVESVAGLAEGLVVDIKCNTSIAKSGLVIASVDRQNKTVTFETDPAYTLAENTTSWLVVQNSLDMELTGLKAIFENDTLYGIDRTKKPWMKPILYSKVGDLKESHIRLAIDRVEEEANGKINFIVCSWGVRRALMKILSENSTRVCETMTLEGGYTALSYNGIPVVVDRFCPKGTMYLLNTDDFALHQLCDWQWLEGEDGKILKQVPGKPVYTATLVKYAELMCYRPGAQACLTGITEA